MQRFARCWFLHAIPRDAQLPIGRYEQSQKYSGFGNRDDRDRWGGGPDRERQHDEDRAGAADRWRRPSKPDLPPHIKIEEQAA